LAARLFGEAATHAAATRVEREAERARAAMVAAREAAEQSGGAETARTLYAQARAEESAGSERLAQKAHDEAQRRFNEAARLCEVVATGGGGGRQKAAERVRAESNAARKAAEANRAPQLAASAFRQAAVEETEAVSALDRGEYEVARERFERAGNLYAEA